MGTLRLIKDGKAEMAMPLLKNFPVRLGREEDSCEVVIFDPSISRVHARIYFDNGEFHIQDLDSRYGTYVNNHKIEGPTTLEDRAQIMIGSTLLQFCISLNGAEPRQLNPTEESILAEDQIHCPNPLCGSVISSKYSFCPHCGTYQGQ